MTDLSDLTPRQRDVAALVAEGLTDKAIASKLGLQCNTVRVHVVALAFRMKIPPWKQTRVEIARWWWRKQQAA